MDSKRTTAIVISSNADRCCFFLNGTKKNIGYRSRARPIRKISQMSTTRQKTTKYFMHLFVKVADFSFPFDKLYENRSRNETSEAHTEEDGEGGLAQSFS